MPMQFNSTHLLKLAVDVVVVVVVVIVVAVVFSCICFGLVIRACSTLGVSSVALTFFSVVVCSRNACSFNGMSLLWEVQLSRFKALASSCLVITP